MRQDIPSRRELLRGTLAFGSSLCVPTLFSGCDSKNSGYSASKATPAPAPGPATTGADKAAVDANKVKKETVQYQEQPKGEQKCSLCMHFIAASNACKLVEGPISPDGWCIMWAKKA